MSALAVLGDGVSDVTSVNTVLQQGTSIVRLNIQFEITDSTTMALAVLMQ